jgi:hypothetical protein
VDAAGVGVEVRLEVEEGLEPAAEILAALEAPDALPPAADFDWTRTPASMMPKTCTDVCAADSPGIRARAAAAASACDAKAL